MKAVWLALTILLGASCLPESLHAADQYWVSFTPAKESVYNPGPGPIFLMKIDVFGNILIPPQRMRSTFRVSFGRTALSHGPAGNLTIWFQHTRYPLPSPEPPPLWKAIVGLRSIGLISKGPAGVRISYNSDISVTQKGQRDFLAGFGSDLNTIRAYSTTAPRSTWVLARCDGGCGSEISADGRMLAYATSSYPSRPTIFLQPLTSRGLPVGKAQAVAKAGFVGSPPFIIDDITGVLQGDKRIIMYSGALRAGAFLRVVRARTGEPIGSEIRFADFENGKGAIDPLGRFVLYNGDPPNARLGQGLIFQALDALGNPSGKPRFLGPEVAGIDILKD